MQEGVSTERTHSQCHQETQQEIEEDFAHEWDENDTE